MGLSRRHFFAGLGITTAAGVATGLTSSAWMLETRALAMQEGLKSAGKATAVARILFNENPLGPRPPPSRQSPKAATSSTATA